VIFFIGRVKSLAINAK